MKRIIQALVLLTLCTGTPGFGRIKFAGQTSAIKLLDAATLNIRSGLTIQNGILEKNANASIIGQDITFSDGVFISDGTEVSLVGDPRLDDQSILHLNGNDEFTAEPGLIMQAVQVSGKNNLLDGQPSFLDTDAITLQDGLTTLTVAFQSVLDKNIVLNGGQLYLGGNLIFGDDARIKGSGLVNFNGYRLMLGGNALTWNDDTGFIDASDIVLNSNVTLGGQWLFDGDSNLNGNGYILNLAGNSLRVKANTTLTLSDIKIKGLGTGSIIFDDNTACVRLAQVEVEMDNNFTITVGGFYADGPTTIVTKNRLLTFDNYGTLTVDGIALTYESLAFLPQDNIRFTMTSDNLVKLNGGIVRRLASALTGGLDISSTVSLSGPLFVTDSTPLISTGNNVLDGNGNIIFISYTDNPTIIVNNNSSLVFTNVLISGFNPDGVQLGNNAELVFGDDTKIELSKNVDLKITLTFGGDVVFEGQGHCMDLGSTGSLFLTVQGSSLLLQDITLKSISGTNIQAMHNNCTFSLKDVSWCQDAYYSFTVGNFDVLGNWRLHGGKVFSYRTPRPSTIFDCVTMTLDGRPTMFSYEPPISNRDLLVMTSKTSTLALLGASLNSSTVGMRLTNGTLFVDGKVQLYNPGAVLDAEGFSFGNGVALNDLDIELSPGASLNLASGILDYQNVN
ncbi:hypothetical protein K2W90_02830 [Candidatus Babeliales bacterium]|nr:hypothetical protein [Candidatus Babeliales bacterium]